ncbi:MAG: EAL domain-containing protein, partial [Acidobacteria bacterium]|nr:EAL domain-containing protein [Acidobacteriota bacterium]
FKIVNDTAGHQAGDELLKQLAGLLQGVIRRGDTLARLGGDEFGLLLRDCPLEAARERAYALVATLRRHRFVWEGRRFEVGASVGLVPINGRPETLAELLSRADIACYSAKERGRNRVSIYSTGSGELDLRREAISRAADLSMALEAGRFRLFAQPIYSLRGRGEDVGFYEILLRLDDGYGSLVSPGEFIPVAESFGLMGAIDRWVVESALEMATELLPPSSTARISINLSGNSLAEESLLDFVYDRIHRSKISPERICFEITETAAIRNLHHAAHFITELKKEGCRFALDDFGSGLASFSYLKELPIDYLKIDGGFVRNMTTDSANRAMVAAIHQIGQVLGLGTIAEHVGSVEVVSMLRDLGVDYGQGYALG